MSLVGMGDRTKGGGDCRSPSSGFLKGKGVGVYGKALEGPGFDGKGTGLEMPTI